MSYMTFIWLLFWQCSHGFLHVLKTSPRLVKRWDESGCVLWGNPADSQPWFLFRLQTLHRVLLPSCHCDVELPRTSAKRELCNTNIHTHTHHVCPSGLSPAAAPCPGPSVCVCEEWARWNAVFVLESWAWFSVWPWWLHTISTQPFITACAHTHTQLWSEHTHAVTAKTLQTGTRWNLLKHKKHQKGTGTCSLLCCLEKKQTFSREFILSCSTSVSWTLNDALTPWHLTPELEVCSVWPVIGFFTVGFPQWAFSLSSVRSCAQWNWSGFSFQSSAGKKWAGEGGTWELRLRLSIQHGFTSSVVSCDFECVVLLCTAFKRQKLCWMSEQ